jgi:hypothetical protein
VASYVAEYADPYVKILLEKADLHGKKFIIIRVSEFDEVPVICKKDSSTDKEKDRILTRGRMYTRTRRIPESAMVMNETEIREILVMAVDNGIRKYLESQARIEIQLVGIQSAQTTGESDDETFNAQLQGLK